jgi:hypothetical protein
MTSTRVGHGSCNCVLTFGLSPEGPLDRTSELTDSLIEGDPRVDTTDCPHWRSVFSSVFKEPKLGHVPLRALVSLAVLVADRFRRRR